MPDLAMLDYFYGDEAEQFTFYRIGGQDFPLEVVKSRLLKLNSEHLPHFLRDSIPAEHKDGIDIGRELLRRSHVLIVCGDEVDESVKNDIAVAQRLGITATTLDGILKIHAQGENEVEG